MENKNEVEIDLVDLYFYLIKRVWIILLALVAAAVIGFIGTKLFLTPQYTATTRVYVLNQASENTVVYSDFQTSTQLLNDYQVLITGQNVTKQVIKELGLQTTATALGKQIQVTAPESTARVLQISVTDPDPQQAANIANRVREVAAEQLAELMDLDAVKTVYEAETPQSPSSPNVKRNTALCALLGAVAAAGILVVIHILDDTIRTEEDVERYLGMGTLGVIPISSELNVGTGKTSRNRQPSSAQTSRKR